MREKEDELLYRKLITFDLNDKRLRKFYPCPEATLNPYYYKKAWGDIARFMKENGFEHSQYSVYVSKFEMTIAQVSALTIKMDMRMPWLYKCLNAISVTNVGEQYDLMKVFEMSHYEQNKKKEKIEKGETLDSWKEEIAKERAKDKGVMKSGTEKSHSKSSKER